MSLPQLTPQQRADALEKAHQARRIRSDVRARLKNGRTTLADVLRDAEANDVIGRTKVTALLTALPGVGRARAAQIMDRHGIAEGRRVRGLGADQAAALKAEFGAEPAAAG